MKISIFKNKNFSLWVDYSKRKDCIWVFEIKEIEAEKLQKGCEIKITKWVLKIIETEEYLEKEKQEKLKTLKIETAEKIYKKHSKEKQTTILYKTLFLFIWKMLEDTEIKAKFSEKELQLFWKAKNIFLDMQKDIKEYNKEKRKLN